MQNFDDQQWQPAPEDQRQFLLRGHTYTIKPFVHPNDFALLESAGRTGSGTDTLATVDRAMARMLIDADGPHWLALRGAGTPAKCERCGWVDDVGAEPIDCWNDGSAHVFPAVPDIEGRPLILGEMLDVYEWIVSDECWRPTKAPSASGDGRNSTGLTSTERSPLPEATPTV